MTLATLQFPLYRFPNELGTVFAVLKNGVDAVKRAVREACRGLLMVDLLPTHAAKIDDITYCYKPHFPLASSGIGDIIYSSERRRAMTNLPTLSTRAKKALDVLADGGKFVHRLERNGYTGREQFAYRLIDNAGCIVRGVGLSAFYEIKDQFLALCEHNTSVSTYYKLRAA
jgi:hypothetical protein